jgi:hypothetical protein
LKGIKGGTRNPCVRNGEGYYDLAELKRTLYHEEKGHKRDTRNEEYRKKQNRSLEEQ